MAVMRIKKTENYTVMSNHHFKNRRLSLKAKGLLSMMLSLPDDWDYTVEGLTTLSSDGRDSVRSAISELEAERYIIRTQPINAEGKFSKIIYDVYENPLSENPLSENPLSENPTSVNPTSENQTQLNTNKSNTNKSNNKATYKRPTLEEVNSYISEKGLSVDGEKFFTYFEEGDWIDSRGNPVRNWKQKLLTWDDKNDKRTRANHKGEWNRSAGDSGSSTSYDRRNRNGNSDPESIREYAEAITKNAANPIDYSAL